MKQLAKLRMLKYYNNFLDQYLDHCNFKLIELDTNSNYITISVEQLENAV